MQALQTRILQFRPQMGVLHALLEHMLQHQEQLDALIVLQVIIHQALAGQDVTNLNLGITL